METTGSTDSALNDEMDGARDALQVAKRQQHEAVDAAFTSPGWYFMKLGGLLLIMTIAYAALAVLDEQLNDITVLLILAFVLGVFGIGLGILVRSALERQGAVAMFSQVTKRDLGISISLLVGWLAAWIAVGALLFGSLLGSLAVALGASALGIAAGGRWLQRLARERAHRRIDQES